MNRFAPVLRAALGFALAAGVVSAAMGALPACGQTVPPKEPEACKLQVVEMSIIASPRINLTDGGEARPVQLRIYQLASDVRINNASFEQMWKADKATLADEFVKSTELSVYPDSRTDIKFERDEKAMMLAAVALYRTPKGRSWYTVLELPPPPGKGACSQACPSGECDGGARGPTLNPRFVLWLDGTSVDEGSDHIDDYPKSGRRTEMHVPFNTPGDEPMPTASPPAPGGPRTGGGETGGPAGKSEK